MNNPFHHTATFQAHGKTWKIPTITANPRIEVYTDHDEFVKRGLWYNEHQSDYEVVLVNAAGPRPLPMRRYPGDPDIGDDWECMGPEEV